MQAIAVTTPIFIIIAIGYFFKRLGFFSPSTMRETNRFLFWVAMPALIVRNVFSADMSHFDDIWLPIVLNLPGFLMVCIGWFVGKSFGEEPRRLAVTVMSSVRSNQIFVGFPIAWLAFGGVGLEAAAIYLAMTLVMFQLLSIGGAQLALEGEVSSRTLLYVLKTLFKNPLFVATVGAVVLSLFGLNHPPQWADTTLKMLADIGSGMALMMVGTEVVFDDIIAKLKRVQKIVLLRLVIHPLVTYFLLSAYGAPVELVRSATLLSGTPIAVNSLIVAKGMGMDSEYMTDAVITTTVLSMLTLTAMLWFMGVA